MTPDPRILAAVKTVGLLGLSYATAAGLGPASAG
jgi:hypothetical protein